jgi:CubicO group peptidase (beta-lactamase class C family)
MDRMARITHIARAGVLVAALAPGSAQSQNRTPTTDGALAALGAVSIAPDLPAATAQHLTRLVEEARKSERMRAAIVEWRGQRVLEAYFHGSIASEPRNVKSITKTLNSLLLGIALDRGLIRDLDATLPSLFPEQFADGRHADKRPITLRHLLTMSSGLGLHEEFTAETILDSRLRLPVGSRFDYDTPSIHLLSLAVARACKCDLQEFAHRELFAPIGARIDTWRRAPDGVPMGGNDSYLRPSDLARLGELVRRGGAWNGRQVISKQWIEASLSKQIELPESTINHGTLATRGFGYLWWLLDFAGEPAYASLGHGGQELIVFPERELTLVFASHWPGPSSVDHYRHLRALIDKHVLPAFGRRLPPAKAD